MWYSENKIDRPKSVNDSVPSIKAGGISKVVYSFFPFFKYACLTLVFFSIRALRKKRPAAFTKKVTSNRHVTIQAKWDGYVEVTAKGMRP